ncbi:MAG: zinc ribbon domain-containing protein [Isosphaeraceae bacterium]
MAFSNPPCARCGRNNPAASRFCAGCGLPLGAAQADADAGFVALGPYEAPEPADPDLLRILNAFVAKCGFDAMPATYGYRLDVPVRLDRRQVVYVGPTGTDAEGRPLMGLVSVCGPATDRDSVTLLKWNARIVEGHFAVKTLLGEDYFVVIHNIALSEARILDPPNLVRRIAELADGLEDRLSRGKDLY